MCGRKGVDTGRKREREIVREREEGSERQRDKVSVCVCKRPFLLIVMWK